MDQWEQWGNKIAGDSGFNSGNIYQNYANAGVINASPEAITGNKASIQASIDEKNRKEALAAQQIEKEFADKKEADKNDPNKARKVLNQDGTYSFYNGINERININQFSLLTGLRPDEILADSENPEDQKFVQDYKVMREFASAWVNGDNARLQEMRAADPEKFNQLISTYKTPGEMVQAFRNYYGSYYGNGSNQGTATFSPGNVTGPGDDIRGKAMAKNLMTSSLQQTLTPISTQQEPAAPDAMSAIGDYGPWALLGRGWAWGDNVDARRKWEEERKSNPWVAYSSYLRGN